MKTEKKELIGVFTVVNNKQELRQVIVSQDIVSHYSSEDSHTKSLHLDTIDGVEVNKTNDPDIFELPDGSILRIKNSSRWNK
jgi:hypothetical protein